MHAQRVTKAMNNVTRSPPSSSSTVRITNGSHQTQKPSQENPNTKQRPCPLIIYMSEPEVYQTQPCNFKATVQRLTGLVRSEVSQKSEVSGITTSSEDNDRKDHRTIDGGGKLGYSEDDTISMLIDHRMNDIFQTWDQDDSHLDPDSREFLNANFNFSDIGSHDHSSMDLSQFMDANFSGF